MNSYKTGDKVRCINPSLKGLDTDKTYTISWCYGVGLIVLEEVDGSWDKSNFELLQEEDIDMKGKFKAGDKVIRIHPSSKLVVGDIYIIKEILSNVYIILEGYSNMYNLDNFELAEQGDSVVDTSEILTPLQVAEAFLNEENVQGLSEDGDRWYNVTYPITLSFSAIQNQKFRLKPKTIVINGVEVPAPTDVIEKRFGYTPSLCHKQVHTVIADKSRLLWATEEDAQQVLDAMLIPFNEINKGER